jgi:hypothetical protein
MSLTEGLREEEEIEEWNALWRELRDAETVRVWDEYGRQHRLPAESVGAPPPVALLGEVGG